MSIRLLLGTIASCGVAIAASNAHAARPLPGYQCLNVKMTAAEAADPNFMLTVRKGPSPQAPVLGTIGLTFVAPDPLIQQNGFIQVVRADQSVGWVPATSTKRWQSADQDPNARCLPEILDNGRIGFLAK